MSYTLVTHSLFKHWTTDTDATGLLWARLNVQEASANTLKREVLTELNDLLSSVEAELPAGLAFISGKDNGFIAGADIHEFSELDGREDVLALIRFGQSIMDRIDALPCPTAAVINGFCMGGGTELALACDYRITLDDPRIQIALPEVRLGIHPGYGGTMRSIRVLGIITAMDMMLTGRNYHPSQARAIGLVDEVVAKDEITQSVHTLIQKHPGPQRPAWYLRLLNTAPLRPVIAGQMRKKVAGKANKEHYPAPYALIDLWQKHGGNEREMLNYEAESVADLSTTSTAQNLVRVFMLQDQLKSQGDKNRFKPQQIHVIGAGIMGGDIAAWCALRGMRVSVQDTNDDNLARTRERAEALFGKRLRKDELIIEALDRLQTAVDDNAVSKADVVIEAIFEDRDAKISLYQSIESKLKSDAILATNTSSISLEDLSQSLSKPSRLLGLHFFNPVASMPLLEIVHGRDTTEETIAKGLAFGLHISKLPLNVKSSPGFLVNRILLPYMLEAAIMVDEGIPLQTIDRAAEIFGMPMGPIELADTVGLDVGLSIARVLSQSFDFEIPHALAERVEAGNLGKKTGEGFYQFKDGRAEKPSGSSTGADLQLIQDRLVLRFLNETIACREEGITASDDLLDAGIIFGTGFAPFRGGPLQYIRETGQTKLFSRLKELHATFGERFTPHPGWNNPL